MTSTAQHVPAFIEALTPIVKQYGYIGVGGLVLVEDFGVPAPGETVLITAAFFAGLGHLDIALVFVVGFAGAVIGDNIGFAIGTWGGGPLVKRYGKYVFLTPERVERASAFFNRHGGNVIIIARFIEGLRQANGIIAGLSRMHWLRFTGFNAIGAALWVAVWSAAGYFGGSHIALFLKFQLYFAIAVGVAILVFAAWKLIRRHRNAGD